VSGTHFRLIWRQTAGAAADAARLLGGLWYWNLRKGFYRLGWVRHNPCQNPSDADSPGSIRCTACVHWHAPGRFRHVCPDLIRREGEWRCARARNKIRPYWSRVAPWWGALALVIYLAGTAAIWGFLRFTTAPGLAWSQVARPSQWQEIPVIRASYFTSIAMRAFAEGRTAEAMLALGTARHLHPEDYAVRLLRAQFAMYERNFAHADAEFASLWQEHPTRRAHTAITFHDTLLANSRIEALARHCLSMVNRDSPRSALWVRSLLHTIALGVDTKRLRTEYGVDIAALPTHARKLIEAEIHWQEGDLPRARELLRQPYLAAVNPLYAKLQVMLTARRGDAASARVLLSHYLLFLAEFELQLIRLDLAVLEADEEESVALHRGLLLLANRPDRVERLLGYLIRQNRGTEYRALDHHLRANPELAAQVSGPALWLAGLACGEPERALHWRTGGRHLEGDYLPEIDHLNFTTLDPTHEDGVPALINSLTLPREVIYALQLRMSHAVAAGQRGLPRVLGSSSASLPASPKSASPRPMASSNASIAL